MLVFLSSFEEVSFFVAVGSVLPAVLPVVVCLLVLGVVPELYNPYLHRIKFAAESSSMTIFKVG